MDRYTEMMRKFGCVCTPQFSAFLDYPKALKIYNFYRSHAVGAYWQRAGLTVVPTLYLGQPMYEWDWCFEGYPENSSVAVSTVGVGKSKGLRRIFVDAYNEMIKRLHPYNILWYGEYFNECDGPIYVIPSYNAQKWRNKR